MRFRTILLFFSSRGDPVPGIVRLFAERLGLTIHCPRDATEIVDLVNRSHPACIVLAAERDDDSIAICRRLKDDTFTAIVPVIFLLSEPSDTLMLEALDAGADEVLTPSMIEREQLLRLRMIMQRADRDVSVHPTTRLPGTVQIERDISERIRSGELFAVCYADLDHFKEFNDRYGYNEGDRVILLLSRILRDVVKAFAPEGFIGHIGGDDFIFNVPLEVMPRCCEEIIAVFDELIAFQYPEEDRKLGYFEGVDRRGSVFRVPIMTVSIGVVTNQRRRFTHTARVSEVVTEMKSYAKTLPGSVFAVDRRSDDPPAAAERPADAPSPPEPAAP